MRALAAVTLASAALAATLAAQAQAPTARDEEFARRQYDSGVSFFRDGRYGEAMKDFQAVVDAFPNTAVADDALLQIASYQLDVARNEAAAQTAVDRLFKDYPDADATPMAYVLGGRITISRGRTTENVDAALASFERVPRLFPGSDAVPAALFNAGEALRVARRPDEALDRFRRVTMEYPRSIWTARATLASGISHVQSGRASQAFEGLQRIRQAFPGSPEAATALAYNSILYRLYVRVPQQPPYAFANRPVGPEGTRYRDLVGLIVDDQGRVLVGQGTGVAVIGPGTQAPRLVAAQDLSAFAVDERGRLITVRRDALTVEGGDTALLAAPEASGRNRPIDDIPAIVVLSSGERLVSDARGRAIVRVSPAGQYVSVFAAGGAERMTRNRLDDVAVIERDGRSIAIFDRDGKVLGRLPQKGTGYQFDSLADIAYDPLGHLYVLDRGRASVLVFGPGNRLLTTITMPGREAGSLQRPRVMGVDMAGRLFIYDDSAQRIQVYQ